MFFKKRSVKLLTLFAVILLLMAGFLASVVHTVSGERHLPSRNSTIHDRALRGSIRSRDHYTLARSNKTYTATVFAPAVDPNKRKLFIRLFSIYSGIESEEIRKALFDRKGRLKKGYVTLSKSIDAVHAVALRSLAYKLRRIGVFRAVKNRRGIEVIYGLDVLENGEQREYPLKDTLEPVLGYVRNRLEGRYTKVVGQKGLERRYDRYLNLKRDGLIKGMRDVSGTIIRNRSSLRIFRRDGYDLYLNIPLELQRRVEVTLDRMKQETQAKEIVAAVMESRTGRLLALASSERFDPAHITRNDISKLNPKATEYPYEPGSVMKPITLSIALDLDRVTPESWFPLFNGRMKISERYTITDDEKFQSLTATDIIVHSSNIGISQIAWRLSGEEMHRGMSRFGFGRPSGIDLSRELRGRIKPVRLLNNKLHRANQSYGYGMTATFAQLLKAYSAFNNEGVEVTPRIVDYLQSPEGRHLRLKSYQPPRRVIRATTAKKIHRILRKVVAEGTGVAARYPGLDIGGKTGTAHIAEHGHYVQRYNSSFYGFANDDQGHRYTLGVLVIEARGYHKYFAAQSAVPTFRNIVQNLVELGYLQPSLTPQEREAVMKQERERRAAARKRQAERTRRIKELLRLQRERIRRKPLAKPKPKPTVRPRPKRRSLAPSPALPGSSYRAPAARGHRPAAPRPSAKPRPTPKEALPDMF